MIKKYFYYCCFLVFISVVNFSIGAKTSPVSELNSKDILIKNVFIINGLGDLRKEGSVRISGETIKSIGNLEETSRDIVIDGNGLILAPGFIDTHSHHDEGLFIETGASAAISQGITTIVRGMDGSASGLDERGFTSLARYSNFYDSHPVAINVASFSAHNSIRSQVMGKDYKREASEDEITRMQDLVALDMQAGAYGLSTGLEYDPGIYSSTKEVIALAKVAANYGGKYKSHIRSEDRYYWQAVNEIIEIGKQAQIPVNIDHWKLGAKFLWGKTSQVIEILDAARAQGIEITADVYPYVAWSSSITTLFPDRNFDDLNEAEFILENLASAEDIRFVHHSLHPEYVGKTVEEIAKDAGVENEVMLSRLASDSYLNEALSEYVVAKGMIDSDVRILMNWSYANVTSDGGLECSHPRGCGSFPRVLGRYLGKDGIGSLERAVYKMTGLSAAQIGIKNRGIIKPGAFADLVLFDPVNIIDKATYENPQQRSRGIHSVWINGKRVLDQGKSTGVLPGRVLLKNQ